ncbi:hypothetical protein MLD38_024174 [Melastoma candidum]|uniref:Uncharacterized protein n=1 Tax=Melastoma candidum TaxID=119954 RepID=A0ACB9NSH3_9MYRT|nr:hypothetical protein MLD38_024174 [Melastoma candidum]
MLPFGSSRYCCLKILPGGRCLTPTKLELIKCAQVLAHLYSSPKAKYIPVCKEGDSFTFANRSGEPPSKTVAKASFWGPYYAGSLSLARA